MLISSSSAKGTSSVTGTSHKTTGTGQDATSGGFAALFQALSGAGLLPEVSPTPAAATPGVPKKTDAGQFVVKGSAHVSGASSDVVSRSVVSQVATMPHVTAAKTTGGKGPQDQSRVGVTESLKQPMPNETSVFAKGQASSKATAQGSNSGLVPSTQAKVQLLTNALATKRSPEDASQHMTKSLSSIETVAASAAIRASVKAKTLPPEQAKPVSVPAAVDVKTSLKTTSEAKGSAMQPTSLWATIGSAPLSGLKGLTEPLQTHAASSQVMVKPTSSPQVASSLHDSLVAQVKQGTTGGQAVKRPEGTNEAASVIANATQVQPLHSTIVSTSSSVAGPTQSASPTITLGTAQTATTFGSLVANQVQTGPNELRVKVHPQGMGDIVISVSRSDAGVQVHVEANTMQTMQWLSHESPQLTQAIRDAGVDVTGVQVSFGAATLSGDSTANQQSRRGKAEERVKGIGGTSQSESILLKASETVDLQKQTISVRV